MDLAHHDLETKAGFAPDNLLQDAHVTHAELMRTFDAFKAANDERIASIERRSADVLHDDKVARIDAALDSQTRRLDELTLKSARPHLGLETGMRSASAREHKAAFEAYVRSGESAGLRALEVKAMSAGTPADGGYLVPDEVEREIGKRLAVISPIRVDRGGARDFRQRLQEAVHDHRPRDRMGGGDRLAPDHQLAGAGRTLVPRSRTLRDAGGDAGAAGG